MVKGVCYFFSFSDRVANGLEVNFVILLLWQKFLTVIVLSVIVKIIFFLIIY